MKKRFYNGIIRVNQKTSARNKYYTNIIYSCSLLDSVSNKIITVTEITL
ncbi:unknown [Clostridium sp. CAG:710]|nr:unknown [Clostridium sp. CAG:710]